MRLIYLLLFIAILLQSCQYEPTGSNYVEVDPYFEPAQISIHLPDLGDTIWVNADKENYMKYFITGETDKLIEVHVFFDSLNKIANIKNHSGSFKIPKITTTSTEYHTLDIITTTKSGTGSLADLVGAEGNIYHNHCVIVYVSAMGMQQDSLRFAEVNGKLQISWDAYYLNDFQHYIIEKKVAGYNYKIPVGFVKYQGTTSVIDESYVGESAEFEVSVFRNSSILKISNGKKHSELPEIKTKHINLNETEISWTKAKYWGSFKNYVIQFADNPDPVMISNINTLSYRRKVPLVETLKSQFVIRSKVHEGDKDRQFYSIDFSLTGSDSSFEYSNIAAGTDNYLYYNVIGGGSGYYQLHQFDITVNKIVKSINLTTKHSQVFSVSPNGKYILYANGDNLVLTTPSTFPEGKIFPKSFFPNEPQNSIYQSFSVSDKGIAALSTNSKNLYIFDSENIKVESIQEFYCDVIISKDGDYILTYNDINKQAPANLYFIDGSNLILVKPNFVIKYAKFSPVDNKILIYTDAGTNQFIFYDCLIKTNNKLYHLKAESVLSMDFVSGYCLTSYNSYKVLDFNNSFSEVDVFTLKSGGKLFLKNKICYFDKGKKWRLSK